MAAIMETRQHFTAEELLAWSRRKDPTVSRATVYRALALLARQGILREMDLGRNRKFYDPNYHQHPDHSHIICQDCGRIFEFENQSIVRLASQTALQRGFRMSHLRLQLTASCLRRDRRGRCIHPRKPASHDPDSA